MVVLEEGEEEEEVGLGGWVGGGDRWGTKGGDRRFASANYAAPDCLSRTAFFPPGRGSYLRLFCTLKCDESFYYSVLTCV